MDVFPRSFLLVFEQLSVGGFLALSVPPFHEIQRGYYKSSGFVYILLGTLALIGRLTLSGQTGLTALGAVEIAELFAWGLFVAAATGYWITLWSERFVIRARLFTTAWLAGLVALLLASESYRSGPALSLLTVVFPLSFVLSALALGTASAGMLLGHWYLIDRNLSLAPLRTMLAFYAGSLVLQSVVLFAWLLALSAADASHARLEPLLASHLGALVSRLLASPLGAGILAEMIRRTLRIPQTMAATGLFYIAVLAVLLGELLGRYLLFRTGLPL